MGKRCLRSSPLPERFLRGERVRAKIFNLVDFRIRMNQT
jgi:hypothetical protein